MVMVASRSEGEGEEEGMAQFEQHHHHLMDSSSHYINHDNINKNNNNDEEGDVSAEQIQTIKALVSALSLISRNLPLPQQLLDDVTSFYHAPPPGPLAEDAHHCKLEENGTHLENQSCNADPEANETEYASLQNGHTFLGKTELREGCYDIGIQEMGNGVSLLGGLMINFEDAIAKQRMNFMSGAALRKTKEARFKSNLTHHLSELKELPSKRGDDLQTKSLLELHGLKLADLQENVRSEVSAEYDLREECANPGKQLFDWGLMRLRRTLPLFGMGDASTTEADERQRRRRDAERQTRLEEEERNRVETKKRKFFNELLNAAREFQLQGQAALKRRKQRNDGVQAWHARQRQRATRAEKLRFQALKADDQEAYMRMVEESKNERLTTLLEKTNQLLVRLGAAVQRQKDAEHADDSKTTEQGIVEPTTEEDEEVLADMDGDHARKKTDLLEGQRQYNSVIHSIQEKVTEQPTMLVGGELRPYQLEGLQWMLSLFNNNLNGILADEMGLGKTIQTIALIAYLMENKGVSGPHMIIAPKAVLPNWAHEFSTWAPSIPIILYDGRPDERKALREESGDGKLNVLITHYDLIMRDKAYLKKIHWHYMIVDEGHRLKNHECALARTLVTGYRIRRRLLLTGTPIQNSLQELWALLNFLLPSIFNSVQNFEEWFNAPFADRCDVSLTEEEELLVIRRLHHVIRPFLLRRKKDEVEKYLPSKIQVTLKCDLSAWQKVYYQQVTESGRVGLESGSGKSKSLLNLSMQLRKCCNHPYLFFAEYDMRRKEEIVRASGKFELLDRLLPKLQRAGHRVLLFSQMTRLMDILEIYLNLYGFMFMRLDGTTKTEERGVLLQKFNEPDSPYFMFLLSTRAGGLGLNLQTADTVILFDSDWNPQMDQQAEDRAHRIGQKKEVRVFVLVSVGSIEEEILERAKQKRGIDAKVIQAGLFNNTSTAQDRREMLEEIMRRGTNSLGTDVPSEREINRLAARNDEEFWLFEKMDEERRQQEGYRSRLMEEHEVPDWVFSVSTGKNDKGGENLDSNLGLDQGLGKRRRREVVYTDILSETQWMKAVEGGADVTEIAKSQLEKRTKKKQQLPDTMDAKLSNENADQLNVCADSESYRTDAPEEEGLEAKHSKKRRDHGADGNYLHDYADANQDFFIKVPKKLKSVKSKTANSHNRKGTHYGEHDEEHAEQEAELSASVYQEDPITWKALKRKRSSHSHPNTDNRGHMSGNRENR